ncbi:OstA-like protein [Bacteroidota bacterium]
MLPFPRIWLLLVFNCFSSVLVSQTRKIKILHTDILRINNEIAPNVRMLIGNVKLEHNNAVMYCDSANYFADRNKFEAFNNVKIYQGDSISLFADYIEYKGDIQLVKARNNVILSQDSMTLYTDHLDYYTSTSTGHYYAGGRIINKQSTLTSINGQYYANMSLFHFSENVEVVDSQFQIFSDTLKYNTKTEMSYFLGPTIILTDEDSIYCEYGWYNAAFKQSYLSQNAYIYRDSLIVKGDTIFFDEIRDSGYARHHIEIIDIANEVILKGNKGQINRSDEIYLMTDSALLIQIYNNDSMYLHADTLFSMPDTSGESRIIKAYYKVKFFREDIQGKCDSLVYSPKDSIIRIFYNPVLWSGENQITSDYIEIFIKDNKFDKMYMESSAFIISQEDFDKFNQIKGRNMTGYFRNNELYRIDVSGNGQTIYFPKEKDKFIGMNQVESSDIVIYVENRQIDKIKFITQPTSILRPLSQITEEEKKLKDFNWYKSVRPITKYDIFRWEETTQPQWDTIPQKSELLVIPVD